MRKSNRNNILLLSILFVLVLITAPMSIVSAQDTQNNTTDQQTVGQPVLVGTVSVEKSELLSQYLRKAGIRRHQQKARKLQYVENSLAS